MPRFQWPMDKPVVTRNFFFEDPLYVGGQHAAIDIIADDGATYGKPVYAVAAGVAWASPINDRFSGWNVYVDHDDGWRSGYRHFIAQILPVNQPIPVAQGQLIGYANSTGTVTGPHLHFDLWCRRKCDPTAFYKLTWWAHDPELYLQAKEEEVPTQAEWDKFVADQTAFNEYVSKRVDDNTRAIQSLEKTVIAQGESNAAQQAGIDNVTMALQEHLANDSGKHTHP